MNEKNMIKAVFSGVFLIFLVIVGMVLLFGSWYSVDEGEVGVKFIKFGANKGFDPTEIAQGYGFKTPFRDRIIKIPFRTQTIGFFGTTEAKGQYSAIQPKDLNGINFFVDMTFRYRLDTTQASEFIEQKGEGIRAMEAIMATAARADSTRGVFGKYAQEDVPQKRIEIALEVKDVLQKRIDSEASGKLKAGYIIIQAVDIRDVQFNSRIEEAIINKQTQKQVAEQKTYELQKEVKEKEIELVRAEKEKQAKILRADGEGQAILLVATARAEGIQKVNKAYQAMPEQYVAVKFAEAIKPTDKVYLGFDSLQGSLPVWNMNQLIAQEQAGGVPITQ